MKTRFLLCGVLPCILIVALLSPGPWRPAKTAGEVRAALPLAGRNDSTPPPPASGNGTGQNIVAEGTVARDRILNRAILLASRRDLPAASGTTRTVKLVEIRGLKYPRLRVEETADASGRIVHRTVAAANHLLALPPATMSGGDLHSLAERTGIQPGRKIAGTTCLLMTLTKEDLDSLPAAIAALNQSGVIAEPDYMVFASQGGSALPNDPGFRDLWGLNNTGQTGGIADADIDAPAAWGIGHDAPGVIVGVIDSGVDYTHPDLVANMWTNSQEIPGNGIDDDGNNYIDDVRGWDFVSGDNDPMDDHYHGTHCAGTIGASGNNGTGITGVCWNVKLMALKFLDYTGSGYTSDAIAAVAYATAKEVTLTSNSWGGGGYSQFLRDAIQSANSAGILFIAAAGNDGSNLDTFPDYPAAYDLANIVSVAATDDGDQLAYFSNYGAVHVDLGAPGVQILSAAPAAGYQYLNGTSMACPHVAGACALVSGLAPALTPVEIKQRLLNTVDSIPALTGKCVTGGRLNLGAFVALSAGPLLQAKVIRLSDATIDGAAGNGDGIFNPGESVVILSEIENIGSETAQGVTGTLQLTTPTPHLTIASGSTAYGDIPARETRAAAGPFRVNIAAAAPVPLAVSLDLTLSATGGRTWTVGIPIAVHQSVRLGGLVTAITGGAAIPDTRISWTGNRNGETTTGPDGRYEAVLTEGTWNVSATAPGWLPAPAQSIVLPPENLSVNFQLGRPILQVSPATVSATLNPGQTAARPVTASNTGDAPLQFTWSVNYRQTGGTATAALPFRDDFERDALGTDWTPDPNPGVREIVTGISAAGDALGAPQRHREHPRPDRHLPRS